MRTCSRKNTAEHSARIEAGLLFDHVVGAADHGCGHFQPNGLGGLQIDEDFVLVGSLNRQIGGFFTLQDTVHVAGGASRRGDRIGPVGNQAAVLDNRLRVVDIWPPIRG